MDNNKIFVLSNNVDPPKHDAAVNKETKIL